VRLPVTRAPGPDLEALRSRFMERVRRDLVALGEAVEAFESGVRPAEDVHAEMRTILHRLAGSAGSFGWPEIGLRARRFEERLGERVEGRADPLLTIARWRAEIAGLAGLLPETPGQPRPSHAAGG